MLQVTGSSRLWALTVIAVTTLSAVVRFPNLGRASFWWDECLTVRLVQSVKDATPDVVLTAVSKGLSTYFLLLAPWVGRDTPEWAMRFPSALAGVAFAIVLALLGREISGRALGWKLGCLAAISPFMVWHSREARWYALTCLLVGIGVLCFVRLLRAWHWGWAAGCFVAGLAAASTYAPAVTILLLQIAWLALAGRAREGLAQRWLRSGGRRRTIQVAIAGILFLLAAVWISRTLLIPAIAGGAKGFGFHHLGGMRLGAVAYTGVAYATGYTLGPGPSEWHNLDQTGLRATEGLLLVLGALSFLGLMLLGARRIAVTRGRRFSLALLTLTVVPAILVLAASWWTDHSYAPRYVAFTYPIALALAAAGLQRTTMRRAALFMGGIVIVLQAISLWNLHFEKRYLREDVRAAARYVTARASSQDIVLLFGGLKLPWEYYYRGEASWRMIYATGPGAWSEERLRDRLAPQKLVWVVQARMWEEPGSARLVSLVDSWAPAMVRRQFPGNVIVSGHRAALAKNDDLIGPNHE
jgi:4-amino-4-deoxy-L-arabinose transferase-like glycosyltransferase